MQHDDMENLFADFRRKATIPSDALMDRVLADALQLQRQPALQTIHSRWSNHLRTFFGHFGKAAMVGCLCSAAIGGLITGYADPTIADVLTGGLSSYSPGDEDLFPTSEFLMTEG